MATGKNAGQDIRRMLGIPDYKDRLNTFDLRNDVYTENPADAEIESIKYNRGNDIMTGSTLARDNREAGYAAALGMAAGADEGGAATTNTQSLLIRKDNQNLKDANAKAEFSNILNGGTPNEDIYYDNMVSALASKNNTNNSQVAPADPAGSFTYTPDSYAPSANFNPLADIMSEFDPYRQGVMDDMRTNSQAIVDDSRTRIDDIMDPARQRELQTTLLDPYMPERVTMDDIKNFSKDAADLATNTVNDISVGGNNYGGPGGLDAIAARFGQSEMFGHADAEQAKLAGFSDADIIKYIEDTGNASQKNKTPGAGGLLDQLKGIVPYTTEGMVNIDRGPNYFQTGF